MSIPINQIQTFDNIASTMAYKYYCFVFINNLNYCNIQNTFSVWMYVVSVFLKYDTFDALVSVIVGLSLHFFSRKHWQVSLQMAFFRPHQDFFRGRVNICMYYYYNCIHNASDLKVNKYKGSIKKNKEYFMSRNISIYINIFSISLIPHTW